MPYDVVKLHCRENALSRVKYCVLYFILWIRMKSTRVETTKIRKKSHHGIIHTMKIQHDNNITSVVVNDVRNEKKRHKARIIRPSKVHRSVERIAPVAHVCSMCYHSMREYIYIHAYTYTLNRTFYVLKKKMHSLISVKYKSLNVHRSCAVINKLGIVR